MVKALKSRADKRAAAATLSTHSPLLLLPSMMEAKKQN